MAALTWRIISAGCFNSISAGMRFAVTVDRERRENSVQEYDVVFPTMTLDAMEQAISKHDILIANPSFSYRWFGPRLPAES